MKYYILFLYICCQQDHAQWGAEQEVSVSSPEQAAVELWHHNQGGLCYTGKLIEYDFDPDGRLTEIPIPKISFK
jgi:hypothetical protein